MVHFWLLIWFSFSFDYSFSVLPPFACFDFSFPPHPHGIFCWQCSVVQANWDFFKLLFIWKIFISSSNLKANFARYEILDWHQFPFRAWNLLFYDLLALRVWMEKSVEIWIGFSVYITCFFSLTAFKILSLFCILIIFTIMCFGVGLL